MGENRRFKRKICFTYKFYNSLPAIRLPWPSLEWLLLPAILLGLLALWYGWAALWNGLTILFP